MVFSYKNVCIESLGFSLPKTQVSSAEVEDRLDPLYQRLRLPAGRLELMTGIESRRFWPAGTAISDISVSSCEQAIGAAGIGREKIELLIHGSVCRDHLEPATACRVHHKVGLPAECQIYDVSNACLGVLNGMLQAANMIELGQIKAALVVGSENGRGLVDSTIEALNRNESLTRKTIKNSIASLTIGSASCAVLLTHQSISKSQTKLLGGAATASTRFNELCQSQNDQAGGAMTPLMDTDSEALMLQGIQTGRDTFERFLKQLGWDRSQIAQTVCHQVGSTHRKLMLESIGVDEERDYSTYPWLGNTGSAALPVTWANNIAAGRLKAGQQIALLGIGSGINCLNLGVLMGETKCHGIEKDVF